MGEVTVESGRALLDILAEDSVEADEFRRFILQQSTTYYGEADNWYAANRVTCRFNWHHTHDTKIQSLDGGTSAIQMVAFLRQGQSLACRFHHPSTQPVGIETRYLVSTLHT